ncbi:type IV secretion protein Rhs [Amorphoplanes auranticolor]|uniref:Type IV secretion protein Rhs n=2 Tax=Actinoplanes auranticolor TaxID=47988 RepID=A0A919S851_9ACTN|nr:type IV secretion protein Rhs [Actinoplanes auranticolor]
MTAAHPSRPGPLVAGSRPAGRRRRGIAAAMAAAVAIAVAVQAPDMAEAAPPWTPRTPAEAAGVPVKSLKHTVRPTWTAAKKEARGAATVTWPAAGAATVDLPATAKAAARTPNTLSTGTRAGTLPVWLSATTAPTGGAASRAATAAAPVRRATVEVADRAATVKAGVSGLLLSVARADGVRQSGGVDVRVDYRAFAQAYGGDWASRLRLTSLATGRPLPTSNDVRTGTASATVPVSADGKASMVALSAGASGDSGTYTATSLSSAATWNVSQQTGAFSWSYPLAVPPAIGGPEPRLDLGYASSSIDGRTAGTNSQGSWIGDGWEMWPGYIERQYKPCADDQDDIRGKAANNKNNFGGDLCWLKPEGNATISFNGRATELVKSSGDRWKGVSDDGSRIELLKDPSYDNGDTDGEYWRVTTTDGIQYFFGRSKGPAGASGATATQSVWTVPVYGNHPDEPGYAAGDFSASRTTQAWRWNLDYVVDTHGNTMNYFYERETGAYGREGNKDKRTTYDRGGWLSRIEYGNRANASITTQPAARVLFDVADRCETTCWSGTDPVQGSWRDTPWDQFCKAAPCVDQQAVTFWTAKRLSRIRSQVYTGTGDTFSDVTWWTLRHKYLQTGENSGDPMWLAGITRTGKVITAGGGEESEPEVVFDPGSEPRPNRVDAGSSDGRSDLFRYRVNTITTASGAQIAITYSQPECRRTALPTVHDNTKTCFPQYYAPAGETAELDWFHKYRVTRVDVYDNTGGFDHEQVNYDYLDAPAWHYDDSELVDEKKRTWGQFRGYGKVRVRKGLESGVQSATEYRYFRGMHGDKQPNGTRTETVTDSQQQEITDHDAYAGIAREVTTTLGAGGPWLSGTISTPAARQTASSGPLKAAMVNTPTTRNRTKLSNGTTRWTKTVTTYNDDNFPEKVDDLGNEATTADDRCIRTWYARNDGNWMLGAIKKTETVGVNCATTPSLPDDMLAGSRTTYDAVHKDWNTYLPVKGDVAKVEQISAWSGTTPTWTTTAKSTYDEVGRIKDTYDALEHKTSTTYTPELTGPLTATTATDAMGRTVTTTFATAWQVPVTTVDDANTARTDVTYDGLGRSLKVWLPGRAKTTYPNAPTIEHIYLMRNNAPTAVTTKTLLPTGTTAYRTSITLLDGLLRERQTQTQATGGGRVLTDTVYNSRGLVDWVAQPYYDTTNQPPLTDLVGNTAGQPSLPVPALTLNVYDGAGRLTDAIFKIGVNEATNEKWRTKTVYAGEKTTVIPPEGGTATTGVTDARGNAVELRQYKSRAQAGGDDPATFDKTVYRYTDRGELAGMTDAAGNTWTYTYDQRGRKLKDEDPDRGTSVHTYDPVGRLATTTDARGVTLANTYDPLGRRTTVRNDSINGPVRAEWIYDTLQYGVGQLTKSIRYEPAGSTNAYTSEVTKYDPAGRPLETRITLPDSESGLCAATGTTPCTYTYAATYRPDGQTATTSLPAVTGLPAEKLTIGYNDVGNPSILLNAGVQIYVNATTYNKLDQLTQLVLGQHGNRTEMTHVIDTRTGRLTNTSVLPEKKPEVLNYTYQQDPAGNLLSITDTPAGGTADTQCFRYDHHRRLTEAWTPTTTECAPDPDAAALGGPARYWQSYRYDQVGNRTVETDHVNATVRAYQYPAPGGPAGSQPHAVTSVETTGAITKTDVYGYDETGNTHTRPGGTAGQTLTWDPEGHLATVTDSTGKTSYLYDADGNRLIRRDPTGATLYLHDGTEIRKPTSGTATGTRYYAFGATPIATRTATGVTWLTGDHHNTSEVAVANADLSVSRRRTLPFGADRGTAPTTWPMTMDKGFVGGTKDNTGLTHLGAREYDPIIGRFISVDPLQDLTDPQQWHGYAYAGNAPTNSSDPSGLIEEDCAIFDCYGYNPDTGCHKGCGSTDNVNWGKGNGKSGSAPDKNKNPDVVTTSVVLPAEMHEEDKEEFKRRWVEQSGKFLAEKNLGGSTNALLLAQDQADLATHVCNAMGREKCGAWYGKLYDLYLGTLMDTGLAGMDDILSGHLKSSGAKSAADPTAPKSNSCNSFSGETRVLMADGSHKLISEVREGDRVIAEKPETGERGPRTVTHAWVHGDTLYELRVGDERIVTTEDHPYWNKTAKQWQRADSIPIGDELQSGSGNAVTVQGFDTNSRHFDAAYNLTVDELHTFFVVVGNTPVLVHNCDRDGGVYVFTEKNSGLPYVGQTNNFDRRLAEHARTGKRDPDDPVTCIHVCGDQHAREAVESEVIDLLGGKDKLANKANSPGLGRRGS